MDKTSNHIIPAKTFVVIKNSKTGEIWNLSDKVWIHPTNNNEVWECHLADTIDSQEDIDRWLDDEKFSIGDEYLDYICLSTLTIETTIRY